MQAFNTLYINSQAKPIINNLTFIITFLTFSQKKQKGLVFVRYQWVKTGNKLIHCKMREGDKENSNGRLPASMLTLAVHFLKTNPWRRSD